MVGWTDPEGRRPYLGALLLAYYDPQGRMDASLHQQTRAGFAETAVAAAYTLTEKMRSRIPPTRVVWQHDYRTRLAAREVIPRCPPPKGR